MKPRKFHVLAKDNAEYDATGMLRMYPVVCVKANHAFNAHLSGIISKICVGITLFVSKQGFLGPHQQTGRR